MPPVHPRQQYAAPPLLECNSLVTLLGRIPERHPARIAALSVIRGESVESIQPLIDALVDPSPDRWRVRVAAAWALSRASLTDEQADASTAALLDVVEQARPEPFLHRLARAGKRHAAITLAGALSGTVAISLIYSMSGRWSYPPEAVEVFAILASMIGFTAIPLNIPASFLFDRSRDSRSRAAAAEALGVLGQPESVGALSGALFDSSRLVREAAAEALHRVLPLLNASHFGLFGSQSISNLGRALNQPDAQLVSKVLGALALVGTSHAIPFVKRAAESGRTVRLRDAAADVLTILEQRQSAESRHATLLRPTTSPADPSLVLVRPSTDTDSQTRPELLLRAAGGTEG